MSKRVLIVMSVVVLIIMGSLAALAAENSGQAAKSQMVVVTGRSTVQGKDFAGAINRAKADALRTAIEQVLGLKLQSQTVLRNELLDQSTLEIKSQGGIKTYRMLEYKLLDDVMVVRLEVEVVPRSEDTPVDVFADLSGVPRVAVIADPDAPMSTQTAMDALKHQIVEAGCELLDRSGILAIEAELTHNIAEQKTLKAAVNQRADMVIYCHTIGSRTKFDGASEDASITFEALAFDTLTGTILAVSKSTGRALHAERFEAEQMAAMQAGNQTASKLEPALRSWWAKQLTAGVPYQLLLSNVSNEKALEFVDEMRSQPGIVDAALITWDANAARILVRYFGRSTQLQRVINDACRQTTGIKDYRVRKAEDRYLIVG